MEIITIESGIWQQLISRIGKIDLEVGILTVQKSLFLKIVLSVFLIHIINPLLLTLQKNVCILFLRRMEFLRQKFLCHCICLKSKWLIIQLDLVISQDGWEIINLGFMKLLH